jgi:hypothetical protein
MSGIIVLIMSMFGVDVVHQGHTWWTTDTSTVTFDAQPGDTINIVMSSPNRDQCDAYGGTLKNGVCWRVDF